jgi:glycerol-3-phosphate acyltransferase PlsY
MLLSLSPLVIAAIIVGGYLLGSIPFGVIATRLGGAGDVRAIGSGSIGATNVLRTGRKDLALITLLGDGGKGVVAVLIAKAIWGHDADVLAGAMAFVGHLYPVWLKFRGGKGVATFFGVMLACAWPVGLAAAATWLVVFAVGRISSLSALTAALLSVAYAFLLHQRSAIWGLAIFTGVLIFIRHRANIERLLKGEEPRFTRKPKPVSEPA